MSNGLTWRMLRDRIARGETTGVLCPRARVPAWMERLDKVPFLRKVGENTLYFPSGAVVLFCTTQEEAQALEGESPRPVVWIDEDNILDAPLPAPKPGPDGE